MRRVPLLFALILPLAGCPAEDDDCLHPAEAEPDRAAAIEYRNPETGLCEALGGGGSGGGGSCGDWGGATDEQSGALPAWAECSGFCESLGEDACLATADCRAAYADDCGPDTVCEDAELAFLGCWGVAPIGAAPLECAGLDAFNCSSQSDCVAVHWAQAEPGSSAPYGPFGYCADEPGGDDDPVQGSCSGEVACDALPPECPDGTVPGVRNGCWSGYCIPVDECEDLPACAQLAEPMCIGRGDCAPIYEGVDCSCDDTGCSCADWLYASCEDN